jgi:hypothetical protein
LETSSLMRLVALGSPSQGIPQPGKTFASGWMVSQSAHQETARFRFDLLRSYSCRQCLEQFDRDAAIDAYATESRTARTGDLREGVGLHHSLS